jgi:tetraacyldisaccharide 4'-kinase
VHLEAPGFWYTRPPKGIALLLAPLGWVAGLAGTLRLRLVTQVTAAVPVICVGNFTVGGTGKTPLVRHLVGLLARRGERPCCLTRGYRGRIEGPHLVDPDRDGAAEVGDEPLLLARDAITVVARDRVAGAVAAVAAGATVIVMDDGMQNPSLAKDLTLAAVDGARGIGNGLVMPAGPLRLPMAVGARLADAVVVIGDGAPLLPHMRVPRLSARIAPVIDAAALVGRPVVAFAGIGRPQKLFDTLLGMGLEIAATFPFPDHHAYGVEDAERLLVSAEALRAQLVTTEKDWVRLPAGGALGRLRSASFALPVRLEFEPADARQLDSLVEGALARRRAH